MWQKRADTDAPLHKTFRDPAEKEARSNREKKEFKTDRLPKRAFCVLVYLFLDQSNLKIQNFKMKS